MVITILNLWFFHSWKWQNPSGLIRPKRPKKPSRPRTHRDMQSTVLHANARWEQDRSIIASHCIASVVALLLLFDRERDMHYKPIHTLKTNNSHFCKWWIRFIRMTPLLLAFVQCTHVAKTNWTNRTSLRALGWPLRLPRWWAQSRPTKVRLLFQWVATLIVSSSLFHLSYHFFAQLVRNQNAGILFIGNGSNNNSWATISY